LPFFFFVVLGVLRALYLLSRQSTTWATPSPFCFGYFGDRVSLFAQPGTRFSYFMPPTIVGNDRHTPPCLAIGRDRILLTFCLVWTQIMILPISAFQVVGLWAWATLPVVYSLFWIKVLFFLILKVLLAYFKICFYLVMVAHTCNLNTGEEGRSQI
jgi:hypothetical protein